MKRLSIALLALTIGLSACTSDDDPEQAASPSETPSATASPSDGPDDDASPTPSPEPEDSESETDGAADGEDDGGDADGGEATAGDATDDGATSDGTTDAASDDGAAPDSGAGTPGGPAADTPSTPVSYDASGSAFAADTSQTRRADFTGRCFVVAGEGETVHECVKLYSDVNSAWMVLVEATDADGATTVTAYRWDGSGFTSALRAGAASADEYALSATDWQNGEDLARAATAGGTDLLAWDRSGEPRVVARVPASGAYSYTAQRVVRRTSAGVEVLAVSSSGGGLAGARTAAGSEEDVALRVYDAWVRKDRAAAAPYATDAVLKELFEDTPAPSDSYRLDGTDCGQAGSQVACGFTARFDGRTITLTWTLGTVDGSLKVVKLDGQG